MTININNCDTCFRGVNNYIGYISNDGKMTITDIKPSCDQNISIEIFACSRCNKITHYAVSGLYKKIKYMRIQKQHEVIV